MISHFWISAPEAYDSKGLTLSVPTGTKAVELQSRVMCSVSCVSTDSKEQAFHTSNLSTFISAAVFSAAAHILPMDFRQIILINSIGYCPLTAEPCSDPCPPHAATKSNVTV